MIVFLFNHDSEKGKGFCNYGDFLFLEDLGGTYNFYTCFSFAVFKMYRIKIFIPLSKS